VARSSHADSPSSALRNPLPIKRRRSSGSDARPPVSGGLLSSGGNGRLTRQPAVPVGRGLPHREEARVTPGRTPVRVGAPLPHRENDKTVNKKPPGDRRDAQALRRHPVKNRLGGTPATPADAIATLQGAIDAVDAAATAENQLGGFEAILGDFGSLDPL